jgi:hypothetical protein
MVGDWMATEGPKVEAMDEGDGVPGDCGQKWSEAFDFAHHREEDRNYHLPYVYDNIRSLPQHGDPDPAFWCV